MLTIDEFNQIKASLRVMGGTIINDCHHVPEKNVMYLLQEFVQKSTETKTISIPCKENF